MRPWIKLVENDGKAGYGGGSLPGFVQLMGHGRHKIFWLVDEIRLLFVVQFCSYLPPFSAIRLLFVVQFCSYLPPFPAIRLLFVVQFCMFHIVSFVQLAGHMTKLTLAKAKSRS